jgi:hypothetical protein
LSADQFQIVLDHMPLLDREKLPPEYSAPLFHLQSVIQHHFGLDDTDGARMSNALFGILIDSALAVPSPDLLRRVDGVEHYDPSVRYARSLFALQQFRGAETDRLATALVDGEACEVERLILAHTGASYLSAEAIYADWLRVFEARSATSMVADARAAACRYRMNYGGLVPERNLTLLMNVQAPIIYLHADHGFVKHDWNLRVFDADNSNALVNELLGRWTGDELTDFLFRTGEFHCPFADTDACTVAEDQCYIGITHPGQLPVHELCRARERLAEAGIRVFLE